jgi:hypothetical protein
MTKSRPYQERGIEELDTFYDHVHSMTIEDLHSKSDIACELAVRDSQIEHLLNIIATKVSHRCSLNARENLPQFLYVDEGGV